LAYDRRFVYSTQDDNIEDPSGDELIISNIISSVITNDTEQEIVSRRIMGTDSAQSLSDDLLISVNKVYQIEALLKEKIQRAIQEAV